MGKKQPVGVTAPSQFRLGADALGQLDGLVRAYSSETGDRETRSSVVRKLIHKEYGRRIKGGRANEK